MSEVALLRLSGEAFAPEEPCVASLLSETRNFTAQERAIRARAERYVTQVRAHDRRSGLEQFQQSYNLSSQEGIMLMCLAEALLRIPDAATADALIQDKLGAAAWDAHIGSGRSWLVSAGAMGLELAGRVSQSGSAGEFIGGLIHRLGEPVVRMALRQAMKLMGGVFVLGDNIRTALQHADASHKKGRRFSFDMLGEGARSGAQAQAYFESYLTAIRALKGNPGGDVHECDGISIKLTALHPRVELRHWESLEAELLPRLKLLLEAAAKQGVPVTIDAEEATRLDVSLRIFEAAFTAVDCPGIGLAVQAYQKRALGVISWLRGLSQATHRRIAVRLVKGAYWDSEIKRAQVEGLADFPVFTRKYHTDISYLACARQLLVHPKYFYPQFATHNARTIASVIEAGGTQEYEFQRLHGMGEALYETVLADTPRRCRIYAPVGTSSHLLSYLIRRILENGANSSFVHGLYDAPLDDLLADPIALSQASGGRASSYITLPASLYGARRNSRGYDLGNAAALAQLEEKIAQFPAQTSEPPADAEEQDCAASFARAQKAFPHWGALPVEERATCLEHIADLFAQHESELLALCRHEGKKTLADAIAELREAIDYCRYYAAEARKLFTPVILNGPSGERNTLTLVPRGVVVAISPWNFPLAIFTGQVTAALATGNCVIAKPAEETPEIAARAVQLMHEAGIPKDVLQILCGKGETIGAALTSDARADAVVFTGSTETARAINRALASRDASLAALVAETGGQNCMVVDSSALIEQAVDDIMISAFGSAGQRCSSLRVAFVQEDIADELLGVLAGAMEKLRVGDVADAATDIGPVISKPAYDMLSRHIQLMHKRAKFIAAAKLPESAAQHLFIAAHVFEIPAIDLLPGEIFGPVLHVIRYKASMMESVIRQINSTGYGLTFGIQSRIDETIRVLSGRVRAGNIYVNRSMIGAVVGVQPFGGMGLSGTGPKAGGPHYLPRFCVERTLTVNTAAVGGNLELLTKTS